MTNSQPKSTYLHDYQPSDFAVEAVHLHVELSPNDTIVKSNLSIKRSAQPTSVGAPLVLAGEDLQLKKVVLAGVLLDPSQYQVDAQSLTIPNVPDHFNLEIEVVIKPAENTKLMGLYCSHGNYCTQCESQGFRRITYYLDRPDIMAPFTTTIVGDKTRCPILLSNGNLIAKETLDNNRHLVRFQDPFKKPSYLFALVAGDFDVLEDTFTTRSQRQVQLQLYLEKGFKDQGHHALNALKKAMRWDEEAFGREYDLDTYMIVAVSDFNMGAMENKGLNIFNTRYILADKATATDTDYLGVEDVIGHEYFHNWSGNRVTCRDWFQITLKEGLTVFREQLFIEDMVSPGVMRINSVNQLRNLQFPEDRGPMAHPIRPRSYIEINNFYTKTVYLKGSEVIRMVQTLLGKAKFREAMDLYFSRHDGQAVTTEDFIQAMQDASGVDFTQFRRWYDQAGTPIVSVTSEYDENKATLTLTVAQHTPPTPGQEKKEALYFPFALGLLDSQGEDMPTQLRGEERPKNGTRVLVIQKPVEKFEFVNVKQKPMLSLLRHFSAPVILNYPYTDTELLWLFEKDHDYFARWEALQLYIKRLVYKLATDCQQDKPLVMDPRLITAFEHILLNTRDKDYHYLAMLMTLPSLTYLLDNMEEADIDALFKSYRFVSQALAKGLTQAFLDGYHDKQLKTYSYNTEDMGKRSFKNRCLAYLVETKEASFQKLAFEQFSLGDNMTDVMGALMALIDHDTPYREQALQQFYEQWQHQPLVVNKWLTLQAGSSLPTTLERVKALMQHPAFNIKNPNNCYALLRTFSNNPVAFHEQSGAGYDFIAEQVLAIDPLNSHVAATILQPLTLWRKMDTKRQKMMKRALERIGQSAHLSKDVYEIVTKSLV